MLVLLASAYHTGTIERPPLPYYDSPVFKAARHRRVCLLQERNSDIPGMFSFVFSVCLACTCENGTQVVGYVAGVFIL